MFVATYRYLIGDQAAATKSSDLAIKTWVANGATSMSRYVTLSGLNTGQWMFAIRFESAETWAKAMTAVRASPEVKQWTTENKAAGNVLQEAMFLQEV